MARKLSKTIQNHPAVADYDLTDDCGDVPFHDVLLKEGWTFIGEDPWCRRRTGLFETVAEFKQANPIREDTLDYKLAD
ncbi:hypothetical protein [Roseibium aggregatum]|uniref:Uncharacterized protein n=1 Tax=Roseibium aggregatum TaxID=187304 RepID=A0A0M6Y6H4_9HYPH|nr:hypothetical protein [Roseibium aggregatum]CTQ45706.1 hypothetical protein LAL4801_04161 [Roseibium aggregatum]